MAVAQGQQSSTINALRSDALISPSHFYLHMHPHRTEAINHEGNPVLAVYDRQFSPGIDMFGPGWRR